MPISAVTAHQDLIMKDYALSMITLVAGALVGIISLGKIARSDTPKAAGNVVRGISRSRKKVG